VVVDDFSHYSWTFPLRAKSDTFSTLLHFFTWVSTQFGLTIKAVQCDNGREFDTSTSRAFFLSHGVQLRIWWRHLDGLAVSSPPGSRLLLCFNVS
jgi:hypothetical protein